MNKTMPWTLLLAVTVPLGLAVPAASAQEGFTLLGAVPEDVFLCVAGRHNAERKFLDDYWAEVFDAAKQSGVGADVMALIASFLGEEEQAQVDRLKDRVAQLLDGLDLKALGGGEVVFAERFVQPNALGDGVAMLPDMVWLLRGRTGSASKNYEGLVTILQTIASEVNQAAAKETLSVNTNLRHGAKVAEIKILDMAPPFTIAVALRENVIAVALGTRILDESLALLEGEGSVKPLSANSRFKQAFAGLPTAEDEMVFFDMQAMLKPLRAVAERVLADATRPRQQSEVTNAYFNEEANDLAGKGVKAYQQQDYQKALEFTQSAHQVAATDSRIMYNLACFHAMLGHKDEALTWLGKAVEGGFHDPKQISSASDLKTLHGEPRYDAAVAQAAKSTAGSDDSEAGTAMVKSLVTRLMDLPGIIDHVASVEYTDGHAVRSEEITTLVPDAASKPFYAVFGKRQGLENFDRYIPQEASSFSVTGAIDLEILYKFIEETVRGIGPQGEELLATWAGLQQQFSFDVRKDVLGWIQGDTIKISIEQPQADAWVFMIKVKNEDVAREKITSALAFLGTALQEAARKNPMLAMLGVRTSPVGHEKLPGFTNIHVGMSQQPLLCGVSDGYLMLGSSADALALCLATAAGEHPSIRANSRVMAEALIPPGSFRSVCFADKRNFGAETAQLLSVLSVSGGLATMMVPDPTAQAAISKALAVVAKLAPIARKIDFYKSTAEYSTFDGKAWHTRGVTNYKTPSERAAPLKGTAPVEGS